jgi:cation diffusion facilitator CzcD-associated flavoprotein CzcO
MSLAHKQSRSQLAERLSPEFRPPRDVSVVIIGAGFGGLTAAMMPRKEGVTNFRIIERSQGVGGTWFNNRYPGAEVDVLSSCYSWPHHRYPWSRNFAGQAEIVKYVEEVCTKEKLWDHLTLGVAITAAVWQEDRRQWQVTLADGPVSPGSMPLHKLNLVEPPWYGPVCPVVWEGRHREVPPYPDQSR